MSSVLHLPMVLEPQLRDPSVMKSNTTDNSGGRGELLQKLYLAGAGWLGFKVQCWRLHLLRTQRSHHDSAVLLHPNADWVWWTERALHRMKHRRLWSKPLLFQIPCIIQSKASVVSTLKMDWHSISLFITLWHELAEVFQMQFSKETYHRGVGYSWVKLLVRNGEILVRVQVGTSCTWWHRESYH